MSFHDAMCATGGDVEAAAAMVFAEAPGDKRGADDVLGDTNPAPAQSSRANLYEDAFSAVAIEDPVPLDDAAREAALRTQTLGNPDIAERIMLEINPQQLPQICALSSFFADICRSASFRRAYQDRWFIRVRFLSLDQGTTDLQFFKTRAMREVKAALEAALQRPPNSTELTFGGGNPTAQSSLAGMLRYVSRNMPPFADGDMKIYYRYRFGAPYSRTSISRHWLEDGTFIDVSRD